LNANNKPNNTTVTNVTSELGQDKWLMCHLLDPVCSICMESYGSNTQRRWQSCLCVFEP